MYTMTQLIEAAKRRERASMRTGWNALWTGTLAYDETPSGTGIYWRVMILRDHTGRRWVLADSTQGMWRDHHSLQIDGVAFGGKPLSATQSLRIRMTTIY